LHVKEHAMPITFRPGLLPPQPGRRRLRLADYLTVPAAPPLPGELPTIPTSADYLGEVAEWPMYGNDAVGDCGPAGLGHLVETYTRYAGGTTVEATEADVIAFYSAVSGYRPGHPSTDVGLVLQDMLDYARRNTFCGHEFLAFAEVDMSNPAEIRTAIDLFGGVLTGINLPRSAEDQFNAGKPWTVVSGSPILGGHAVPWMGYGADGSWGGVTWAAVQAIADAFRRKYVAEGWVLFPKDWANSAGITPTGLDLHTLGKDFAALTGEANPYPDAPPPVTPPPAAGGPSGVQVGTAVRSLLEQMKV
jgi:hypothetical protein